VDAVRNALDIQAVMARRNADLAEDRRMEFRVGINLGDVIIEGDDIHGDGVNVAARLEGLCEPGGVYVSGSVFDQVAGKLDAWFDDLGEQTVKNLARPVRVFRAQIESEAAADPNPVAEALTLPDKPSIAVLPFENMSGDPEQEFFADGMAEDIITGLSRYRSLFVIARNSTFAYKGQSPDLRDVSRDLGVKYVLEGSIRKAGSRIRVTAQLIDGTTGSHIWAERYDRELNDIFALQDEITETIVAAIGPEIDQVERERAQRLAPDSLDAWESYQRGLWHLYRFNQEDNAESQRLFRLANAHSPIFSPAQSGLTHALYFSFMHGYAEDRSAALAEAFESGRKAVASDERDADAHFALGRILYLKRELDASMAELQVAVAYNPNFAHAHLGLGTALMYAGEWDRAIESFDRATRLSPHDPLLWIFATARAIALFAARRLDQAEETARQSVRQPTATVTAYFILAATLGQLGKDDEARKVMADVLRMKPDISAEYIAQILPFRNSADVEYVIEGLHKAGMHH
jgi:TolB-like protein/Flp pilus assembly protein TadD